MIPKILISHSGGAIFAAGVLAMALCSCNPVIFDDLPECVPEYRLRLSYDYNMANEERVSQVEAAEVYAFDNGGNLVTVVTADLETLRENDWTIPLDLDRGNSYNLVIWGGLTDASPFRLDGSRAYSSTDDLTCRLGTNDDGEGNAVSDSRFPGLFHGTATVTYTKEDGYEEQTAKLKKNTNILDVVLRREAGSPVSESEFSVKVIDSNGVMAHDNSVSGDDVHYVPTDLTSGAAPLPDGQGSESHDMSKALTARLHLARLMKDSPARLIVTGSSDGIVRYEARLIDLILAAKDKIAPAMDVQEYLDRQDEYSVEIVFPSDEDWTHLTIYITMIR